jgi:hypothetical protein
LANAEYTKCPTGAQEERIITGIVPPKQIRGPSPLADEVVSKIAGYFAMNASPRM